MGTPGNLWTTGYFKTQASRVGPATRRVIDLLFSSTVIAAQSYQPARNILSLGKGDNTPILEQACQRLTAGSTTRAVSYTAVKKMMAAIRAETAGRPTTRPPHRPCVVAGDGAAPPTGPRSGLVGGGDQFRLDNLPGTHNSNHHLSTGDQDPGHGSKNSDVSDEQKEGCWTMTDPTVHIDHTWLPTFTKLRMTAFGDAVIEIANDLAFDQWAFSQKIAYATDKEVAARQERKIAKLLKQSKSPNPAACVEEIAYPQGRTLNRESITRLASCQWIRDVRNVIILGKSSVGKTYLALALLNTACRHEHAAMFYRTDDLAAKPAVLARTDPARLDLTDKIARTDLLVLDDFLTTPISGNIANALFNILAAREHVGLTMITSQFPPEQWYESIPDKVVAESLMNRLIGNAEIINLDALNKRLTQQPGQAQPE